MDVGTLGTWTIPWISARHALTLITLLLVPTVQAITGALLWKLLAGWQAGVQAAPVRWDRIVLGAVLPLAVSWMAVRWLGTPRTALALEAELWPGWTAFAMGLLALSVAAAANVRRPRANPAPRSLTLWATTGGALMIAGWALITSFQVDPGPWLEGRTVRLAVQPPALGWVVVLHAAATLTLGAVFALQANTKRPRLARALAAWSAALGGVTIIAAPWLGPSRTLTETAARLAEQGTSGPAWTTRWSVVVLTAWASIAFAVNVIPKLAGARTLVALAALAACSSQALLSSYRGAWSVRGWRYEDGLTVEHVRTHRRSAFLPGTGDELEVGEAMFRSQCASCHARSGPLAGWRDELGCDTVRIRRRLESLREADRLGHPDRATMPPLVGSDCEINGLATWIRRGNRCE